MSNLPPEAAFADIGNGLLAPGPVQLVTAVVPTSAGQRLSVTIRTASTTLTVFLSKTDAAAWGKQLADAGSRMSGAGLFVPGVTAQPSNGKGQP